MASPQRQAGSRHIHISLLQYGLYNVCAKREQELHERWPAMQNYLLVSKTQLHE